ncbi:MAG: hypothetical protein RMN51_02560 [Verrucomicrobiota bacterium]|nr:hypothetical protein [Limisphaera sp.]MDW8380979.1 hypothetical protein [Verrucomicrobiota bacterium]
MWRLTRREQQVLLVILGLLLVGWTVRMWRETRSLPTTVAEQQRSQQ